MRCSVCFVWTTHDPHPSHPRPPRRCGGLDARGAALVDGGTAERTIVQPLKWPNNVFEMMTMYRSLRWGSRRIVIRASIVEGLEMWQAVRRERQR